MDCEPGVTIDTKLLWQSHIYNLHSKARKTLRLRMLHSAPREVSKTTYEVLVKPTF